MADTNSRVVVITGASAGIGAALARVLARRETTLVLVARRADRLEQLADEARRLGAVEALCVPVDLADSDAHARIVDAAIGRFGRIDVLINNAGYGLPGYFSQSDEGDLARQIVVNLTAPILLARRALPHLRASRGMIINVGSSITAVPIPVYGVYGATKAGLEFWNDALRREARSMGVRVCLVTPGPVATEFHEAMTRSSTNGGAAQTHTRPPGPVIPGVTPGVKPPPAITCSAEDAAERIARLITRPRRRISMLRRAVWPWRWCGALDRMAPWIGDWAIGNLAARMIAAQSSEPTAEARDDSHAG